MSFYELAKSRFSARKYKNTPVEESKINAILEAGRISPTATNAQPQRIYVLQSQDALKKINDITPCAFHAPLVLLVCADMNTGWVNPFTGRSFAETDAAIVTTHMILQAKELGIDSCWVCYLDTDKVKKEFDLPENIQPFSIVPMGYVEEDCKPSGRHFERKPLSETVKYI